MDDDRIEEILEKQKETLILVKKIWRAEKWRRFWTIFRYAVLIGAAFGAFYFAAPYVERFMNSVQQFQNIKNPQDLQKFLEQLQLPK